MRAAFLALAFLASCSTVPPEQPGSPNGLPSASVHLSGTKWRRVDDMNANPHGATLEFDGAVASGYTGCRRWGGSVTQDGEVLRFSEVEMIVATTGAGPIECAEVQAATERSFLVVIEATRYAHYDQDALVLLDMNQQVIAEFDVE